MKRLQLPSNVPVASKAPPRIVSTCNARCSTWIGLHSGVELLEGVKLRLRPPSGQRILETTRLRCQLSKIRKPCIERTKDAALLRKRVARCAPLCHDGIGAFDSCARSLRTGGRNSHIYLVRSSSSNPLKEPCEPWPKTSVRDQTTSDPPTTNVAKQPLI